MPLIICLPKLLKKVAWWKHSDLVFCIRTLKKLAFLPLHPIPVLETEQRVLYQYSTIEPHPQPFVLVFLLLFVDVCLDPGWPPTHDPPAFSLSAGITDVHHHAQLPFFLVLLYIKWDPKALPKHRSSWQHLLCQHNTKDGSNEIQVHVSHSLRDQGTLKG
jgi:hypothetical protein